MQEINEDSVRLRREVTARTRLNLSKSNVPIKFIEIYTVIFIDQSLAQVDSKSLEKYQVL